jgi:hypothetical protein
MCVVVGGGAGGETEDRGWVVELTEERQVSEGGGGWVGRGEGKVVRRTGGAETREASDGRQESRKDGL